MRKKLKPIHPGEILMEEFLKPMELSQNRLGQELGVPPRRINEIVLGKRGITADTALRLARYFGMSPEFWPSSWAVSRCRFRLIREASSRFSSTTTRPGCRDESP